jgi:glycosidase
MKLIIDWVANHTGADHEWTKTNPDYYVHDTNGNFVEINGWTDVIDLNYGNHEMMQALIECMKYWVNECDIDGFRCDMAHLVPLDFWVDARKQCDAIKHLFWLAECDTEVYHEVFDVSYAWAWMHTTEEYVKGFATVQKIREVLLKYSSYGYGSQKLWFTSNHDENSWNGTEYEKYGTAAKLYAVFTQTWPGMPLIYSGQELPNNKRLKFFEKDSIEWSEPLKLEPFYTALLQLRKCNAALHKDGEITILNAAHDDKVMAYLLTKDSQKVLVLLNYSNEDRIKLEFEHVLLPGNYTNLFSGLNYEIKERANFELQEHEYIVLYVD